MPKIFVHIDDEDGSPCRMMVQRFLHDKELIFSLPSAIQSQLVPTLQHHTDIEPEGANLVFLLDHELNRDQAFANAQPNRSIVPTGKDIAEQMRSYFPKCKLVSLSSNVDERVGKLLVKTDGMDDFKEMRSYMCNAYSESDIIFISAASELPDDLNTTLTSSGFFDYPNGTIFIHKRNIDKLGSLCSYFTGERTPHSHRRRSPGLRRSSPSSTSPHESPNLLIEHSPSSGHTHRRHRSSPTSSEVTVMDKTLLPPPPLQDPPLSPSGPIPLLVARSFPSDQLSGARLRADLLGLEDMTSLNASSLGVSLHLPYTGSSLKQAAGAVNPMDTPLTHTDVLSERRQSSTSISFFGTPPTASLSTGSVPSGTMLLETEGSVLRTSEVVLGNAGAPSYPSTSTTTTLTTGTLLQRCDTRYLDDSFPSLNTSQVVSDSGVVGELKSTATPTPQNLSTVGLTTTVEAFFGTSAPSIQIKDPAPQVPLPSVTDARLLTVPPVNPHAFEEEGTVPIQKGCCPGCSIQ